MAFLFRILSVAFLLFFSVLHNADAADVPIIVEDDLSGILGFADDERNTCDLEFWDVLTEKAWLEGQKEITQNQNLIARPDSVLSMTCFDQYLNHLAWYGDNHFPSDPDYANGGLGNFAYELYVDGDDLVQSSEPMGPSPMALLPQFELFLGVTLGRGCSLNLEGGCAGGLLTYAVLEVLILDQLVDSVSAMSLVSDALTSPLAAAACALSGDDKNYYIEENFPNLMIGGRAINEPAAPGPPWTQIRSDFGGTDDVNTSPYNGCAFMNNVWKRSKCYDFATESSLHSPGVAPAGGEHDAFYPVENYKDQSLVNIDYRSKEIMCSIPDSDPKPDIPSLAEIACDLLVHGFPGGITLGQLLAIYNAITGTNPTWDSSFIGAYPPPNPTPAVSNGALDEYLNYLQLRDSTSCAAVNPVPTGYMVIPPDGSGPYPDAICPAPGCWYNPTLNSCN